MKIIFLISVSFILQACGGAMAFDRMSASTDLMESKAAYKSCVKKTPSNCAIEKELYLSDIDAVNALRRGVLISKQ